MSTRPSTTSTNIIVYLAYHFPNRHCYPASQPSGGSSEKCCCRPPWATESVSMPSCKETGIAIFFCSIEFSWAKSTTFFKPTTFATTYEWHQRTWPLFFYNSACRTKPWTAITRYYVIFTCSILECWLAKSCPHYRTPQTVATSSTLWKMCFPP